MNDEPFRNTLIHSYMAQNGGGTNSPRLFASTGAVVVPVAVSRSQSPSSPLSTSMRDRITLSQPRPDGLRSTNYYTETPFRPPKSSTKSGVVGVGKVATATANAPAATIVTTTGSSRSSSGGGGAAEPSTSLPCSLPSQLQQQQQQQHHHHRHRQQLHHHHQQQQQQASLINTHHPLTITSQPTCVTFTKEIKREERSAGSDAAGGGGGHGDSIICHECGRCKCDACRRPRALPSKWICHDNCECSAEALVDFCTCMCCVKGLFYHCTKDYDMDDDVSCADKPCSCNPHRRCMRWGCMSLLTLVLPCLLCYWPMKGCLKVCESCYARYHSHGCQCMQRRKTLMHHHGSSSNPNNNSNKRLLDHGSD